VKKDERRDHSTIWETPYRQPADELLTELSTDAQLGLSETEARARLESHGVGRQEDPKHYPPLQTTG
jgi:hypothetical protein